MDIKGLESEKAGNDQEVNDNDLALEQKNKYLKEKLFGSKVDDRQLWEIQREEIKFCKNLGTLPEFVDFKDLTSENPEVEEYYSLAIERLTNIYQQFGLINVAPMIKDNLLRVRRDGPSMFPIQTLN